MESGETWSGGPRPELRALTGLRGVAGTTVALAHFQQFSPDGAATFFVWHAAVDLFFCLSGFTLSYVYRRNEFQFSRYLIARIARIYPLYVLTLIIAGAAWIIPFFVNPKTYPARSASVDFLLQLFMLNSWPVIGSGVHWNIVAWSISVEWFCYLLLFPLLLAQTLSWSTPFRLLCLVLLSAVSYTVFARHYDSNLINAEIYAPPSQWSYWVNLLRGILGFTAGWIAFASFERRDGLFSSCARFSTPLWLAAACIVILGYCRLINAQAMVFLLPFLVLAATDHSSLTSRLLGSKVFCFLGVVSYSIYMLHPLVLVLFIAIYAAPWTASIYALLVGTTVVVSTCAYFAIEMPARNAIRGLQGMRPAPIVS